MENIPRIIHVVWLEAEPQLQDGVSACSDENLYLIFTCTTRLHQLHGNNDEPGNKWAVRQWSNKDVTRENFPIVYDAVCACQTMAQRVDLLRLEILYRHGGGWYVDADVYFVQSLEALYGSKETEVTAAQEPAEKVIVVCHEDDNDPYAKEMMSTSVIGSTPQNEVFKKAAEAASRAPLNTDNINETTGPFLFGKCLKDSLGETKVIRLPSCTFYPHLWNYPATDILHRVHTYTTHVTAPTRKETVAAHLWLGSWKQKY